MYVQIICPAVVNFRLQRVCVHTRVSDEQSVYDLKEGEGEGTQAVNTKQLLSRALLIYDTRDRIGYIVVGEV